MFVQLRARFWSSRVMRWYGRACPGHPRLGGTATDHGERAKRGPMTGVRVTRRLPRGDGGLRFAPNPPL
jgi:hypothetical protein